MTAGSKKEEEKSPREAQGERSPLSMHEGVEVWEDCCVCEAEPYWLEAMEDDEQQKKKSPA